MPEPLGNSGSKPLSYRDAGVDIEAADKFVGKIKAMTGIRDEAVLPGAGGYAAVYRRPSGEAVACTTDGVGSKLLLCEEFNRYDTIGIDLVAMCANDLICVGAKPAIFLDYFACGAIDIERSTEIIKGIVQGCSETDMLLLGGETAEMPDLYAKNHFDLAGFAVGFVSEEELLTGSRIKAGQRVVAVASSGLHSNGYSLARKIIGPDSPFRPHLLLPTNLYVRPFLEVRRALGPELTGAANITGGGWTNILRLSKTVSYRLKAVERHALFDHMLRDVALAELYRTFNMGMGLSLIVESKQSAAVAIEIFSRGGFAAWDIGEAVDCASGSPGVEILESKESLFIS
ncbi:MAG: phosphoribosylformylglycinamidine cyclo-ligase [Candidatus Obscuribacter phosphatis]|uniref:Phosphoribosylformylglycinamidine cyclo-ligase n=1 Tax=Candidatus Obscuribacter phosphatis TaxID=1906157 RepID=A0A8J7PC32_9BACT|nr:phosphoribosylformylglycinamidine cyclo-ligase [Candidatus Obscuribacter phosphatis]